MGTIVGPIPFTSIDRYAARFGFDDPDAFETLLSVVRAMDVRYIAIMADKIKQARDRK